MEATTISRHMTRPMAAIRSTTFRQVRHPLHSQYRQLQPESLDDYPGEKWRKPPLGEDEMAAFLAVYGLDPGKAVPRRDGPRPYCAGTAPPLQRNTGRHGMEVDSSIFDVLILEPLPEGMDHPLPPEPYALDVERS